MADLAARVLDNYQGVLERIARAAQRAGRSAAEVRVVVVTKGQPLAAVRAAILAGVTVLGENYAEEGIAKMQQVADLAPVQWHMIGHVQGRRARLVAQHYQMVHSLDSLRLARRLDQACDRAGKLLPVLFEFNVADEATKSGWAAGAESGWPLLMDDLRSVTTLAHLQPCGIMAMPPLGPEAESSRPFFVKLRRLREYLRRGLPKSDWRELSIGTSHDYEVAVEEGATMIRVGTAILGSRPV